MATSSLTLGGSVISKWTLRSLGGGGGVDGGGGGGGGGLVDVVVIGVEHMGHFS